MSRAGYADGPTAAPSMAPGIGARQSDFVGVFAFAQGWIDWGSRC